MNIADLYKHILKQPLFKAWFSKTGAKKCICMWPFSISWIQTSIIKFLLLFKKWWFDFCTLHLTMQQKTIYTLFYCQAPKIHYAKFKSTSSHEILFFCSFFFFSFYSTKKWKELERFLVRGCFIAFFCVIQRSLL